MNLTEIKAIARQKGVKAGAMKKSEVIRAIQRAEGNSDCFEAQKAKECAEMNCLWRKDCVGVRQEAR